MMSIDIIKGKPTLKPNAMAAVIRRSRVYDYRIIERSDRRCEIQFIRRNPAAAGGWQEEGRATWTLEDAQRARLTGEAGGSWAKYPRAMLFARAMSEGARAYCPDLFGGAPIYTPEEMEAIDTETGEVMAFAPAPPVAPPLAAAPPDPDLDTKEARDAAGRRLFAILHAKG